MSTFHRVVTSFAIHKLFSNPGTLMKKVDVANTLLCEVAGHAKLKMPQTDTF